MRLVDILLKILPIVLTLAVLSDAPAEKKEQKQWSYLDNGVVRIGIDRSRGAAIGYFALSKDRRNLLNHYDEGRFIQQSYYGDPDGSTWGKKPWTYNPVQGGSYKGEDAKTLFFSKRKNKLHARVEPLHWASAKPCPEAIMQEWISLDGPLAKIRMSMKYTGKDHKKPRHQEVPAMFVDYALPYLMFERNGKLIKHESVMLKKKGGPESIQYDSEWLAYVDDKGFGIGIYTPGTKTAVSYRAHGNGKSGPTGSACSYVAPVRTFALRSGLVVDYEFHLTIGTLSEIRARFSKLRKQ
ncbi:MAG: hypothetical protein AB8F34_15165 [Akkermansiaceae bacterium]